MKNHSLALLAALSALPTLALAKNRPNIIYIMTDQQTATALSSRGNSDLNTPNMDRLAEKGVQFTNAYCVTPLSGPSRAAMFTGYLPSTQRMSFNNAPMPDSIRPNTLGLLLSDAGYECAYAGKWHVPQASMPDEVLGFETLHPHNDYGLDAAAVEFLERDHTRPFFLVASFDNPHNICEYARNQNMPFMQMEEPSLNDCPGLPLNHARAPYDAEIVSIEQRNGIALFYPTADFTSDDWRRYRNAYFRLVEQVDKQIGVVVDAIDKNHLWENTIVVFSSDHGDGMGAHHWNQKSALYEEVVNVPLIVISPEGSNRGKEFPQLVSNGFDFYASVCDWAGIEMHPYCYGRSLREVVEKGDATTPFNDFVVTETAFDKGVSRGWMLRTSRYKYVLYDRGRNREQLFDMESDRGEMRNLAVESKYKDALQEHRELLYKWMEENRVSTGRPTVHFIPHMR